MNLNEVYRLLLEGVRSDDNQIWDKRLYTRSQQIYDLKKYTILCSTNIYDIHDPEYILRILDIIPQFIDALNIVYGEPHPEISDKELTDAVSKIQVELWGKPITITAKLKDIASRAVHTDGAHHKQEALIDILKYITTEEEFKALEIEED